MESEGYRKRGPINGKVGTFIAAIDQLKTIILVAVIVFLSLGFNWTTPGQALNKATSRLDRIEALVESLVRLECNRVEESMELRRDAKLARLSCSALQ
jgi:hypothetical protein